MIGSFLCRYKYVVALVVAAVTILRLLEGSCCCWSTQQQQQSHHHHPNVDQTPLESPTGNPIPSHGGALDPAYRLINRVLKYNNSHEDFELTLLRRGDGNDEEDDNDNNDHPHSDLPCRLPCFTISDASDGRRVAITGGPTLSEVTAGIGWYLRNVANATSLDNWPPMNITNVNTSSPAWPARPISMMIRRHKAVKYSYLMNVCTHSYSLVWYSAQDWEIFIDWMALNGINMMLALTGQEYMQYKVFRKLGLNDSDIRHWFNGPAFLTWSRGQNEYGSNIAGPLPISWMKAQWRLQREVILPRIRELDIIGQLPAFQGNVPIQLKTIYQDSNITKEGATGWMDSLDPLFGKVAKLWMETLIADFGTDHWYQLDGYFNGGTAPWRRRMKSDNDSSSSTINHLEMTTTTDHDETWYRRGVAVYQTLNTTDPDAIWSFQGFAFVGWDSDQQASFLKGFVDSVPDKNKFVIMDMAYDPRQPEWKKWNESAFFGASFVWTVLHNFGGTDGIKGDMNKVNQMPFDALNHNSKNDTTQHNIIGLGATPEGITQNPAYYGFLYEQAFQDQPIEALKPHIILKMHQRYGMDPRYDFRPEIAQSWTLLLTSLYSTDRSVQDGTGVAHWGSQRINDASSLFEKDRFTPTETMCQIFAAWDHLMKAAKKSRKHNLGFHDSPAFQYDLVNLGREVLAQISTPAALNFSEAISATELGPMSILATGNFYQKLLLDLDELVGTEETFRLKRWLKSARQLGRNSNDCEHPTVVLNDGDDDSLFLQTNNASICEIFYEWNARCQVTTWIPTPANASRVPSGPIDYAAKHWNGLIREYYVKRIDLVQQQALKDAALHQPLDQSRVDRLLAQLAYEWTVVESYRSQQRSDDTAFGDYIKTSQKILRKYHTWFRSPCSSTRSVTQTETGVW